MTPNLFPVMRKPRARSAKQQANDVLFDAMLRAYWPKVNEPGPMLAARITRLVRELRAYGAEPKDIAARRASYRAKYPSAADTMEALIKHWGEFEPQSVPAAVLPLVQRIGRRPDPPEDVMARREWERTPTADRHAMLLDVVKGLGGLSDNVTMSPYCPAVWSVLRRRLIERTKEHGRA